MPSGYTKKREENKPGISDLVMALFWLWRGLKTRRK